MITIKKSKSLFSVCLTSLVVLLHSKGSYSNHNYELGNVRNPRVMKSHPHLEELTLPRVLQTRQLLHKARQIIGSQPKRQRSPFLRTEKSLHYAGLSPKEKLSARILEEIESLDALKCLPKALCSISAESALKSHSALTRPASDNLNDKFVNEYLRVMHSIFKKPDGGKSEWARARPEKHSEKHPENHSKRHRTKQRIQYSNEETEESVESSNSEESEETFAESQHRPQYFKNRRPNQDRLSQMSSNVNQMYYKKRFETQWGPHSSSDIQKLRMGNRGKVPKRIHRRPKNRKESPENYSQQFHYVSVPSKTEYGYHSHSGYPNSPNPPPNQSSSSNSYFSLMLYFVPSFIKNIFNAILPSFTFEFNPHYSQSESQISQIWTAPVSTPPNIFADDPFFDGFRSVHHPLDRKTHFEFASRKMKSDTKTPVTTTIDDFMLDARDRFIAAIEIGQTFNSIRKCNAIYSTCPFSHTEVVDMIEIIKQKLHLQEVLNNSTPYKGKRKRRKFRTDRK